MFFINIYNFLNSIDNTLEKNYHNYTNSFIDNFIDELKSYFEKIDCLVKYPEETLFTLDRYEGEYAVCENRKTGQMLNIPKTKISPSAKEGDILRLKDNLYQINSEETLKAKGSIESLVNKTFNDIN